MKVSGHLILIAFLICIGQIAVFCQIVPRFERSECAVAVPESEKNVDCGDLVVLENRRSKSGRTIRLPVAILRSDSRSPKPDPVLKTLGGPGASSLRMIRNRNSSPWLKDRDYIIFEQRGTKYARPSLECPEVDTANATNVRSQTPVAAARKKEIEAAAACFARLKHDGIDLSAFNSAESAADIEDLRRVLKLEKINLYGVSYSARLMLEVMRYFPSGIRSVVLESTLPPEINYDEVGVDAIVRSLDVMFEACKADLPCNSAFPNLEREFYEVVAGLNRKPISIDLKDEATGKVSAIHLNGDDFATWIVDYLFSNEPSATVAAPLVIHKAAGGDLVNSFKRYASDKLAPAPYSLGMRYSVWCSEEVPFERTSLIRAQSFKYRGLDGYRVMSVPDICRVWKVRQAGRVANELVKSSIPTLVLAAQYDAYTPPAWGRTVAERLEHSFFFEVPWAGHGPAFSVPCAALMVAAFIDDPASRPPSDCLDKTRDQFKFIVQDRP